MGQTYVMQSLLLLLKQYIVFPGYNICWKDKTLMTLIKVQENVRSSVALEELLPSYKVMEYHKDSSRIPEEHEKISRC